MAAAISAATACAGCDAPPPPKTTQNASNSTSASTVTGESPRAVLKRLSEAYRERAFRTIEPLVIRESAGETVQTLTAISDFLSANDELGRVVQETFGQGLARATDQSGIAGSLDIFSDNVSLLEERIDGEAAVVTFLIEGRLPLREAKMRLQDGRWRYDPGGGYDPSVPEAFRRMAEGLRMVATDLKAGKQPPGMAEKPEQLLEEIRIRMVPGLSMLRRPHGASSAPSPRSIPGSVPPSVPVPTTP